MEYTCPVPIQSALSFNWKSGQTLGIFQRQVKNVVLSEKQSTIYEVQCSSLTNTNPFFVRLCRASYDIFRAVQKCKDTSDLLRLSHQYRTALAMTSQEIFEFLESCQGYSDARVLSLAAEGEIIKAYELIWHLAEIVLFQALPPGQLTYGLVSWYFIQSQEAANTARSILEGSDSHSTLTPHTAKYKQAIDPRFWPTIIILVLQARPHEAAALLASHPQANSSPFRSMRQMLNTMPLGGPHMEDPWSESNATDQEAWTYWTGECSSRLSEGEWGSENDEKSTDSSYLRLLASILIGHQGAWHDPRLIEIFGQSDGWYFQFTAWLFYTNRFVEAQSLASLLQHWQSSFLRSSKLDQSPIDEIIDELIVSIFEADVLSLLKVASDKFNNWWLVAHLANLIWSLFPDVFTKSGVEKDFKNEPIPHQISVDMALDNKQFGAPEMTLLNSFLPDFFLLTYAENLAADTSLLSIALGYLDCCSSILPTVRHLQSTLICHTKPSTTRMANYLLSEARRRELYDAADEVSRVKIAEFKACIPISQLKTFSTQNAYESAEKIQYTAPICCAVGWAITARDRPTLTKLITDLLWAGIPKIDSIIPQNPGPDRVKSIREVATIISCLYGNVSSSTEWLSLSPELAFMVRYAELNELLIEQKIEPAIDILLDLLTTGSMIDNRPIEQQAKKQHVLDGTKSNLHTYSSHLPIHFQIYLLMQIKPQLDDCRFLTFEQIGRLITVITNVRASLNIATTFGQKSNTSLNEWFKQVHAFLAQALVGTIITQGSSKSQNMNYNSIDGFSEFCGSTYDASEH